MLTGSFKPEVATGGNVLHPRVAVNPIFVIVINYERKSLEKLSCGKMQY